MKKHLLATATALVLGTAMASGASAQIYDPVNVYVDFDKWVFVYELQYKVKNALIYVNGNFYGHTAAESNAVNEQNTYFNYIQQYDPHRLVANIDRSINNNSGIAQFNQDVGNATNQANVLSIAVASNATFADSNASTEQGTYYGVVVNPGLGGTQTKDANILGSINSNQGIAMVNQNAGNQNNQSNNVSLAVSVHGRSPGANAAKNSVSTDPGNGGDGKAAVALSEADLGQFTIGNHVLAHNTVTRSTIDNSINSNSGIVTVNQAAGNFNNQGTVISFAGQAKF